MVVVSCTEAVTALLNQEVAVIHVLSTSVSVLVGTAIVTTTVWFSPEGTGPMVRGAGSSYHPAEEC